MRGDLLQMFGRRFFEQDDQKSRAVDLADASITIDIRLVAVGVVLKSAII